MWILFYLAIGVIFTEFTTKNNYSKFTWDDTLNYFKEVILWLPNLLTFRK